MTKKEIGRAIYAIRKQTGASPIEIKKHTKVQPSQLEGIERGNKNYTIDSLCEVCQYFGLQIVITNITL